MTNLADPVRTPDDYADDSAFAAPRPDAPRGGPLPPPSAPGVVTVAAGQGTWRAPPANGGHATFEPPHPADQFAPPQGAPTPSGTAHTVAPGGSAPPAHAPVHQEAAQWPAQPAPDAAHYATTTGHLATGAGTGPGHPAVTDTTHVPGQPVAPTATVPAAETPITHATPVPGQPVAHTATVPAPATPITHAATAPAQPPPAAAPALPSVTPVKAVVPTNGATAPGHATSLPDFQALTQTRQKKSGGGFGRFVKFVFVLAILGGIGAAAVVYGPGLLEDLREGSTDGPTAPNETDAPLAFPATPVTTTDIRHATFVLDNLDPEGTTRRYEITTDFETRASRVVIDREDLPTLEVLTFLDQAVVRRVGDPVWYRTGRGQFPLDDQLERERWVRQLDELIPPGTRSNTMILESAVTNLGTERMRRLVLTVDPALLGGPSIVTEQFGSPEIEAAETEPSAAVENRQVPTIEKDPGALTTVPPQPADQDAAADPAPPPADPNGVADPAVPAVDAPPPAVDAAVIGPVELEIWVDSQGLVRQLVSPDVLGGETLTVTLVSAEAWLPPFPLEEQVQPLTASALVKLGL